MNSTNKDNKDRTDIKNTINDLIDIKFFFFYFYIYIKVVTTILNVGKVLQPTDEKSMQGLVIVHTVNKHRAQNP